MTAQGNDNIETVRRQPVLVEQGSPKGSHKTDEARGEVLKVRSQLPAPVQYSNKYDDYILKSSTANQSNSSQSLGSSGAGFNDPLSRIHSTKVDPKAASFKVFSCHSLVSFKLLIVSLCP